SASVGPREWRGSTEREQRAREPCASRTSCGQRAHARASPELVADQKRQDSPIELYSRSLCSGRSLTSTFASKRNPSAGRNCQTTPPVTSLNARPSTKRMPAPTYGVHRLPLRK